jgi:hypothetical protein
VETTSLLLAILFTFTVRRRVVDGESYCSTHQALATGPISPVKYRVKLVALASVTLWSAAGIGGRWIGFS